MVIGIYMDALGTCDIDLVFSESEGDVIRKGKIDSLKII